LIAAIFLKNLTVNTDLYLDFRNLIVENAKTFKFVALFFFPNVSNLWMQT